MDNVGRTAVELMNHVLEQPENVQVSTAQETFDRSLALAAQHKAASGNSCVALTGFVEQCAKSASTDLQRWAYSSEITLSLFQFFLEWNETDQHRSMKLVLDLLILLVTKNPDRDAAQTVKSTLLWEITSIVFGSSTKPLAKSATKTLDYLLNKKVYSLDEISAEYCKVRQLPLDSADLGLWKQLTKDLFGWMKHHSVCPIAGRLVVNLHAALRESYGEKFTLSVWHQWLIDALEPDSFLLESFRNYIFLPLFKNRRSDSLEYLRQMNTAGGNNQKTFGIPERLQLAALEVGKKTGLVEEPGVTSTTSNDFVILDESVLDHVASHPSNEIRTVAYSILVTSASTTRPFSPKAIALIRKHSASYFADSDAKFRNDIVSLSKDLFKRLRGSIFVLTKSLLRSRDAKQKPVKPSGVGVYKANYIVLPEESLTILLDEHKEFLNWYMLFIKSQLTPTASYQSHITSLKVLLHILKLEMQPSKTWETTEDASIFYNLLDQSWERTLVDLVLDPFEDVRSFSSIALELLMSDSRFYAFQKDATAELISRAEDLVTRTARADHGDGVAKAYRLRYQYLQNGQSKLDLLSQIVQDLDRRILLAEKDLGEAVLTAPVHGTFAALFQIWQTIIADDFGVSEQTQLVALAERIAAYCTRMWVAVRDILCDDSPEGHLPQELEESESFDTKELLSYSFRAIHESSNLMRAIVSGAKKTPGKKNGVCPSLPAFEMIGNLSFEQLSSLRHRGALSTVTLTFAICCQVVEKITTTESLLDSWYKGALVCIHTLRSTTRRSAGLPAIIVGIISANAVHPSFDEVLESLKNIARVEAEVLETDGSNLPQVHAHNCLREIFKSSTLVSQGHKVEKQLSPCLELAAGSLKSELWAIRNCGLLLLRSLVDCLFGTHESKLEIESGWDGKANRIAYHKYPTLSGVLVNLLRSGYESMVSATVGTKAAESVFPALDIIRRAGPPDSLRLELQSYIVKYLESPVWHVRDMAARSLCSCLIHDEWLGELEKIFANISPSGHNAIHGAYLALKVIIEKMIDVSPARVDENLNELYALLRKLETTVSFINCPDILAAHIEVFNVLALYTSSQEYPSKNSTSRHSSALLKVQTARKVVFEIARGSRNVSALMDALAPICIGDSDTATLVLEEIPAAWPIAQQTITETQELCGMYIDLCVVASVPEPRAVALTNLAELMDHLLESGEVGLLPDQSILAELWAKVQSGLMNPYLSNAILRCSGPFIASVLARSATPQDEQVLRWGLMMSSAGDDDKPFDTRFAAVTALLSLFNSVPISTLVDLPADAIIPCLLALYDALNDDDGEVRDVAALATRRILDGRAMEPIEAADQLVHWLVDRFSNADALLAIVCLRMVGVSAVEGSSTTGHVVSVAKQLTEKLNVDDVLFMVEEQNLFIDELREAKRWSLAFEQVSRKGYPPWLHTWISQGLTDIVNHISVLGDDGPLGWTTMRPGVFAICVRVITGAVAVVRQDNAAEVKEKLDMLRELGNQARLSGLLLDLTRV